MPSDKRLRQEEGRLMRLEAERLASQRVQRKRQARTLGLIVGAIVLAAGAIAIFSADDAEDTSTTDTTETTDTTAPSTVVLPGSGASITGETPCPAEDGSAERTTDFEQAPPMCIDPAKAYTATLETTEGDIVIELDAKSAPETVNNFVVLARYHFYDNVPFHRIVPGFVNQAGDPVGPEPGTGGPGYTIPDELPDDPATAYAAGTVAMANAGPESGGSQFFLVIGDPNGALSGAGSYSVFGKVVQGQDVSEAINALGGPDELPTKPVAITSVTITEA
jgi:cyclophilin family peptidyl-prolyl cis-trans isomerase